jgi:hypothetical protein
MTAAAPSIAPTSAPSRVVATPCPYCDAIAQPEGPPAVLSGTGMVELQKYRCERTPSHWWHQDRVLV